MRMPSSFRSTEASSKAATASATLSAVEASIGKTGWKRLEADRAQAFLALCERDLGRAREVMESMNAQRARSAGTSAAFFTASTMRPAGAPCRRPPTRSRCTKSDSSAVERVKSPSRIRRRSRPRPAPRRRLDIEIARSRSPMVSDGSAAGARSAPCTAA